VFPTDTVYGLACDPERRSAVERLYELKGRPPERPSAVMFFALEPALLALPELGSSELAAVTALLPGPVTLLLANPARRFPLACGPDPATVGLRVPLLGDWLAALGALGGPVMQSSANLSGANDARRLSEVPASVLAGADLVLDAGELPGVASTVVDLREYERSGRFSVVRAGALDPDEVGRLLR